MSLSSFGFFERLKLASIYTSKAQERGVSVEFLSGFDKIDALTVVTERNPNEWIYWYALADNCNTEGFYTLSLDACEKCLQLKPNDPRSTYAIATLYRALTRARFIDNPKAKEAQKELSVISDMVFDPEISAKALKSIGITIDDAAQKSIYYFKETLNLRINSTETQHIKSILNELYEDFPQNKD